MPRFTYPRNQRLALLALSVMGWIFLAITWFRQPPEPEPLTVDPEFRRLAAELRGELPKNTASTAPGPAAFPFDPNTVTAAELRRLGLSERQAAGWLKYRGDRRNAFRQPEDIGRLFVLSESDKERLIPLARIDRTAPRPGSRAPAPNRPASRPAQRFPFDPNTISLDSLMLLGLSERTARSWIKYRSYRPRTFRQPEDLRKLRALPPATAEELLPLVRIPPQEPTAPTRDSTTIAYIPPNEGRYPLTRATRTPDLAPASFDVNIATAAEWEIFPGIGPSRAARIVKYRDALGGFRSVDQVGTAYALPDSVFVTLRPYLTASPVYRTIAINQATEADLYRHPDISRKLATVIIRFREQHGPYSGPDDLAKIRILSPEKIAALVPYLSFE